MLTLEYIIPDREFSKLRSLSPAALDEGGLRYDYCWGEISLVCIASVKASLSFDVPVLDFGLALAYLLNDIVSVPHQELDFTESDGRIIFDATGPTIRVSSNFSGWTCTTTIDELRNVASSFIDRLKLDLSREVPEHTPFIFSEFARFGFTE